MPATRPSSLARSKSRHRSQDSRVFVPETTALLLPEGDIGQSTSDLLDVIEPQHEHGRDHTLVEAEDEDASDDELEQLPEPPLPWYKRPSPWWILGAMPLSSIAMATTIAPRVQIYTRLACMAHRPEYMSEASPSIHLNGIGHVASWEMPYSSANLTSLDSTLNGKVSVNFVVDAPVEHEPASVPTPSDRCKTDPEVLAAVTRLIAIMTTTLGVLSCITTAWWGQLSDRWGRSKVMRFVIVGMMFGDFNFILVARYSHILPGGYYFLIAGPIIDGLLGGMSTASSTMTAYVSDCVDPMNRARVFSMTTGLLFSGMAIGPWLGGRIIHYTGDLLSVFYFAAAIHILGGLYWILLVPESLPKHVRQANLAAQEERKANERAAGHMFIWRLFSFLQPLKMLLPKPVDKNNLRKGWDWNLTLLAVAHAFAIMMMGSYPYKMTYAQQQFGWGAEELGTFLSIVGIIRATYLLIILPVIIKVFKPRPQPIQLDGSENDIEAVPRASTTALIAEPSHSRVRVSLSRARSAVSTLVGPTMAHPGAFDLYLARGSLILEIMSYVSAMFARTGPTFLAATSLAALGGGFNPAVNSLALLLGGSLENGKLFGALSVLGTIASQVFGPAIFAATMIATVETFPQSIFLVCSIALSCSLLITLFVRLPPMSVESYHRAMGTRRNHEATLVASSTGGTVKGRKSGPPQIVVESARD